MAANTVTSSTGVKSGTDPNFIVEYNSNSSSGLVLMLDYTKGTEDGISLTFDVINPSLHATNKFRHTSLSGTALSAYTMAITTTGRYRIPVPVIASEKKVCVNIVFAADDQGGAAIANFMEA